MQNITLHKRPGERYDRCAFKVYDAKRGGEVVGTVGHDLGRNWEVVTADFKLVSRHTTIKAAARVAARVLR